jgi:hypothetical protein
MGDVDQCLAGRRDQQVVEEPPRRTLIQPRGRFIKDERLRVCE